MKALSLFAGGGISETYLDKIGIHTVIANEFVEERAEFYKKRFPHVNMIIGDIKDKKQELIEKGKSEGVRLLIATPPCQGMSAVGMKNYKGDIRNFLIFDVIDIAHGIKPDYFIIENVPKFLKMYYPESIENVESFIQTANEEYKKMLKERRRKKESGENPANTKNEFYAKKEDANGLISLIDLLKREFGDAYNIKYGVYNSADYDTPQTRKRAIILLWKKGLELNEPKKSEEWITLEQAIGSLPSLEAGEKAIERYADNAEIMSIPGIQYHNAPAMNATHIEMMKHTPSGCGAFNNEIYKPRKKDGTLIRGFLDTYKRLSWDKPCATRTMNTLNISNSNNGHPGWLSPECSPEDALDERKRIYTDARTLTLLELMIVTGLPQDMYIPENTKERLMRDIIGEGVPPKMMQAFLEAIPEKERNRE